MHIIGIRQGTDENQLAGQLFTVEVYVISCKDEKLARRESIGSR